MNFIESVKTCFKKYGDYSGRASRSEFWYFLLFGVFMDIAVFIVEIFTLYLGSIDQLIAVITLRRLPNTLILAPLIAAGIRRLHDIGKSGWWLLLLFIPIIGWIYLLYLLCKKGDGQPNRFDHPISFKRKVIFAASTTGIRIAWIVAIVIGFVQMTKEEKAQLKAKIANESLYFQDADKAV